MIGDSPVIVWFTRDLRVADHPALRAAAESGRPVLPVYILDEDSADARPLGGAARWWLHHSLEALAEALDARGVRLVLRRGPVAETLLALADEIGAGAVHWSRGYDPAHRAAERVLEAGAAGRGIAARRFAGHLLFEPEAIRTGSGGSYRVFTPFWNACRKAGPPARPVPAPARLAAIDAGPASDALADWRLLPTAPDWAGGLRSAWRPGEPGADDALRAFAAGSLGGYPGLRDRPEPSATSRLSPHLAFGEVSPRQVWQAALAAAERGEASEDAAWAFLRQIAWRDFAHHVLYANPDLAHRPLDESFAAFPWADAPDALAAWQRGRTGYPIVDAGMRELWATGHMHNRARMIAASFLVKDLLIPWQDGEDWFWDTLVDACPANNPHNWQWVAGCGTDAAPYIRIFNPVTQAERFDPDGAYIRRWVPELAALPDAHLRAPWRAPAGMLAGAEIRLGETYPRPIVDHAAARLHALDAFRQTRSETRD